MSSESNKKPGLAPDKAWFARHPRAGAAIVGVAAFSVGAVAFAEDTDERAKLEQRLGGTQSRLADTRAELERTRGQLSDAGGKLSAAEAKAERAEARAERATAKGPVPDVVGEDADDAGSRLTGGEFDWRVKTVRQVSERSPGTVIAQQPAPERMLRSGQTVTLTVAKAPPKSWKPIVTLSGTGSKRTDEFTIPADEKVRVSYAFSGDGNAIIEVKDPEEGDEGFGDLLLNEIGDRTDSTRLYGAEGTHYLDITGEVWTVSVEALR